MKYLFLSLCACLWAGMLIGQDVLVTDARWEKPLADVYISNGTEAVLSGPDGRADIAVFSQSDTLYFQAAGYLTKILAYEMLEADAFRVTLEPSGEAGAMMVDMQEVMVAAQRRSQRLRDLPFRISSIKPENTALQNPQTMADLLGATGQVYIQKSQLGGGSPMIRGFAANRVLLAVDGVRMNNAIFRQGNLQNVIAIDPHSLESANVLFGPNSVMYGSDALGGVMDFKTRQPRLSPTGKLHLQGDALIRYGNATRERTGHASLGLGTRKFAWYGSVSFSDFGDPRMGSNGPESYLRPEYVDRINGRDTVIQNSDPRVQRFSGYNQINTLQKLRYAPSDEWDLSYAFHHSESSDIPRYDRLILYRNGSLRHGDWYYGPQTWTMHHVRLDRRRPLGVLGKFQVNAAWQRFGESRFDRNFGSDELRARTEQVDVWSLNIDVDRHLDMDKKWLLQYGVEWLDNQVSSEGEVRNLASEETTPIASRYPDGATWRSYAGYSQLRFTPNEQLTLTGGLRYNRVEVEATLDTTYYPFPFQQLSLKNGSLSGSMGLAWRFADALQVNANAAAGFRAPNVDDAAKVFDSEPGNVVVPNPGLQPEFAYNFELGILKIFDQQGDPRGTGLWERLQFGITGFYTLLEDVMVRRPFPLDGQDSIVYDGVLSQVEAVVNADRAWIAGVQVDANLRITRHLTLKTDFTWTTGEASDGEPLRHVAPAFGRTQLGWEQGDFVLALFAVYNGEIPFARLAPSERDKPYLYAEDGDGNPYSPGWYTLNATARWKFLPRAYVQIGLENITDQRYRPYSSGIAGPGLNAVGSVMIRW